jgi:hypothetical protein
MSEIELPDGSIYSSSQLSFAMDKAHENLTTPMVGVILAVNPSDDSDNLTAAVEPSNQKGWRHECTVLIMDANSEPNLYLENVVVPPGCHSGVDNYEEDLPRAVIRSLDGKKLSEHFKDHDITRLDAEWCVVNFIGGNVDKPFITNWWHHPLNKHDSASSGQALDGKSLTQVNLKKNKLRKFRRINGVQLLVSPEGDIYLDTSEANSKLDVLPKVKRMGVKKGGSLQINIKTTQQMEFNWNTAVEGLKAGSNSSSQSREESLPHAKAPALPTGNPKARETTKTIVRFKEDEGTVSTGKLVLYCHGKGGESGTFLVTADDGVVIGQGASGEVLASLSISDGELVLSTPDGDNIALSSDQIAATTKGGASAVLQGNSVAINAASGISLNGGAAGSPITLAPELVSALLTAFTALNSYLGAVGSAMDILKNDPDIGQNDKPVVAAAGATAAGTAAAALSLAVGAGATAYTSKLVTAK